MKSPWSVRTRGAVEATRPTVTMEEEVTLAGGEEGPGVMIKLSPKQEADLEGAWRFGCFDKDPGKPGLGWRLGWR